MTLTESKNRGVPKQFYFWNKTGTKLEQINWSVNNMWIILTILLAITCMWLIKINKDLVDRNNELIAKNIMKSLTEIEEKIPTKPATNQQKELLKKHFGSDKEDNE